MPPTVVIAEALDEVCASWLGERSTVLRCESAGDLDRHLPSADGLVIRTYTDVDQQLLDRAQMLKVVGRAGVGLERVDLKACERGGVQVVYTPDANTQAVVEYVLALIFDDLRPRCTLSCPVDADTFHRLRSEQVGMQLDQLTLGILGFGRIGRRLGRAASALGVRLLVNDLVEDTELRAAVEFPFEFVDKQVLYGESDILSIHVDGRPENHHLIDAGALALLKPSCLLINAARGMVIDTATLFDWLRAVLATGGRAVLDVHDPEPIPPDYPLFGQPNARLLPHLASRSHTAMQNMCWVVRDVAAVLEGRTAQYPAPG